MAESEPSGGGLVGTEAILNADKDDEALNKYKASLGLGDTVVIDEKNPNSLIMQTLGIEWCNPDLADKNISIDLQNPGKEYTVKMGEEFIMTAGFQVQRDMVSRLMMTVAMKKFMMGFKEEYSLGSYPANSTDVKTWRSKAKDEFPNSSVAKGKMTMTVSFKAEENVDGKPKSVVPIKTIKVTLNLKKAF